MKECLFCEGDCVCGTKVKKRTAPLDRMKARSRGLPNEAAPLPAPPPSAKRMRSVTADPILEAVRVLAFNGLLSQESLDKHAQHLEYKKPTGRLLDERADQ